MMRFQGEKFIGMTAILGGKELMCSKKFQWNLEISRAKIS